MHIDQYTRMSPELIAEFSSVIDKTNIASSRVELKRKELMGRQLGLINTLDHELKKFEKAGFVLTYPEAVKIVCFTEERDEFNFNAQPFKISYPGKNINFVFTPKVNGVGSVSYQYVRVENEYHRYGDELSWLANSDAWFFNGGTQKLHSKLFDGEGIKMILANMYCL